MTVLPPRLKLLSNIVRTLALGFIATILVSLTLMLVNVNWFMFTAPHLVSGGLDPALVGTDDRTRWLAVLGCIPGCSIAIFAFWNVWQLFGNFSAGSYFDSQSLRYLRRFAWGLLAMSMLSPIESGWMSLALTSSRPPGQRVLSIGLSSGDLEGIMVGFVFLAIAVVMTRAAELAEENSGFV